jgi:carbohydrate esterase-like sialic acid-specific acetylesterase
MRSAPTKTSIFTQCTLSIACWLALAVPLHAEERPLITFVLAGQSNMSGEKSRAQELPPRLVKPNKNVLFFHSRSRKWLPMEPGKTQPRGFGPEISFGAEMAKRLKAPVGIIKLARGGTSLAGDWNTEKRGSLYAKLAKTVQAAKKTRPLRIVGMLWQQGGADAKAEKMAAAYAGNLACLAQRARKDFGSPTMPFVSGRIPPKSPVKKPFWKQVRLAQQELDLPHYGWVDCDSLEKGKDGVHYTARGMVDLGKLFAAKMSALLSSEKDAPEESNERVGARPIAGE